jgi:hypothetical protein
MQYYEFIAARGDTGAVLPLAKVTVWLAGTTTLAALYDSTGAPLGANPITAATSGLAGFAAANGAYDVQIASADGSYLAPKVHDLQLYDLTGLDAQVAAVQAIAGNSGFMAVATDMALGASSKITTTASDLLLGATSKIAAVAADLALGAGSLIKSAPGAAIDAATSAAAAAASAASIPTGVGQEIDGNGPPTSNIGGVGAFYYDLTNSVSYGPKTAAGWPAGTPAARGSVPSTTRVRIDLRAAGATLPVSQATVTRNSVSTDMLPSDPYTYVPTTFPVNTPVIRVGKGLFAFTRAQQLLAAPGAPVAETVAVPVGVVAVTAWGPAGSAYVSAAGTAVGTGFGSLSGTAGTPQYIMISTAGTITLTPSGGLTKANVVYNPSLPSGTEAVSYIASQSIREADQIPAGSALLAAMQSPQGYLLMGVSDVNVRNYGAPPCMLGMNTAPAWFSASNTAVTLYDPANHATSVSLGNDNFSKGATIGRTWDNSPTVTFGGGSRFETSHAFAHNNGVAVTSVSIGGSKGSGNATGQQVLNGCIGWWEYDTASRLTDEQLWNIYTSQPAPKLDSLLKNYIGATQFTKFIASIHQLKAGVIDHVKVGIIGPSHEGGVGLAGDTNVRSNSWSAQMVADLETDGYSVAEAFCSTGSAVFSGGAINHDNRLSYTGTAPTTTGVDFGRFAIVIPAGTVLTFNSGRQNSRFELYAYTDATSRGAVEVSNDGGITPIVANETGIAGNSTTSATFTGSITNGVLTTTGTSGTIRVGDRLATTTGVAGGSALLAQLSGTAGGNGTYSVSNTLNSPSASMWTKALIVRTYDTTLSNNAWSIKAVGNPVHICLGYAYDPAAKSFVFFNGGADGFNVTNLGRDDDVETSYAYPVRTLGCSLWFGCGDDTNDMASGGTPWATYNPLATSIITNAQLSGSVVLFTDPESSTTSFSRAVSDKVTAQGRAVGFAANVPIYDFYAYLNSDPVKCQWDMLNPNGGYNDTTHLSRRANKRFKSNQMRELFKRVVGLA